MIKLTQHQVKRMDVLPSVVIQAETRRGDGVPVPVFPRCVDQEVIQERGKGSGALISC